MKTEGSRTVWAKNVAIVVLSGVTAFLGWDTYRQHEQNERLENHVIEMETKLDNNADDSQNAMEAFAEIEINLAEIRQSEAYLLTNLDEEYEGEDNSHARILQEIASIEKLIEANKEIIKNLENEVGEKDSRLKSYKNSIISLEKQISDYKVKTDELVAQSEELKKNLNQVQEQNAEMTMNLTMSEYMLKAQLQHINEKDKALRTVYYVVGPFKYLQEINVAEKEGGILGIAAVKTVKDNLDRSNFTEIDMYHYTSIPIYGKDAVLLSKHDEDTYQFVSNEKGNLRWMNITDPERFWENTKYLVIETKGTFYEQTAFAK